MRESASDATSWNAAGYDVVVVGAGNAALSAALAASESDARVLVLEKAPEAAWGGNSFFTGGLFRFPFRSLEDLEALVGELGQVERDRVEIAPYPRERFYSDLMEVSEGLADPQLTETLVRHAFDTVRWLKAQGVPWVLAYGRQAFQRDSVFRFWGALPCEVSGAGQGLMSALRHACERRGVRIRYETMGEHLLLDSKGGLQGIRTRGPGGFSEIPARAVVLACGGFEANPEMRARYLGAGWDLVKVRGTAFNTGDGMRMALDAGAQSYGNFSGCHAVAWDAGAPAFGDRRIGDLFQKHSYPLGIVVNLRGERFLDEGAHFRNYTYAKYGREILKQPGRLAFQIFDQQVDPLLRDEYRIAEATKAEANTVRDLALALDIDPQGLESTVSHYNAAVQEGPFDPSSLDGKGTVGIDPPKSNWALRLERPPFVGYAVTCGITFTFGGLKIDPGARVIDTQARPIPGLFAAGELVGGLYYGNYPGGSGLTAGAVFGRIAGTSAATCARTAT